ncbi:hypothetical protein H0H92_012694 [Tricholoma furcatifolium]|nr:hypothetical protein H0H92_012694 [Tricholoma furcatifolium]
MSENNTQDHTNPTSTPTETHYKSDLAEYERSEGRPVFMLTRSELKLLGIAGPVATMLQYRLYDGKSMPANLQGLMKAGANIGSVIGQFAFDGKELMLILLATVLTMTTPTGTLSPDNCLIYLSMFRILLGVGVGGDYPMSASITSDRANLRKRGTMLAYIFSNQGWGSLVGSVATLIVLACYRHVMDVEGETSKVDGVWRIVIGISLIPGFATLYQRLTLPESSRFLASEKLKNATSAAEEGDAIAELKRAQRAEDAKMGNVTPEEAKDVEDDVSLEVEKKAHFKGDFYGINLNQNVVLAEIGFAGKTGTPWERIFKISVGNVIITALGFVPGYWVTVFTIERFGRKFIQIQGFLLAALFLAILAGRFTELSTASFIVCFAFLQFFFNFGANTTAYCYPAELFPTRYRATAHGISAAAGKCGAIISALAFNVLSESVGTPVVLWSFTLLLPEVKGRDPDLILAEELREARAKKASQKLQ